MLLELRLVNATQRTQLDLRADSPMRDDIGILNSTPVPEPRASVMTISAQDSALKGFTAVNTGETYAAALFQYDGFGPRPNAVLPVEHRSDVNGEAAVTLVIACLADSWRPTDPTDRTYQEPGTDTLTNERKRVDYPADKCSIDEHVHQVHGHSSGSPARRTSGGPDVERDGSYSQREAHDELAESSGDLYERTLPLTEQGHSKAQPAPKPEVEAAVRAQVQRFTAQSQVRRRGGSSPSPQDNEVRRSTFSHASAYLSRSVDTSMRKRTFSTRTRTGCHTCRTRKKKCDEGKPHCQNCIRGSFRCGGYGPKPPGGPRPVTKRTAVPLQASHNEPDTPVDGQRYGFERSPYQGGNNQLGRTLSEYYAPSPSRLHDPHPHRSTAPQVPADNCLLPRPESWHHQPHPPYDDRRKSLPASQYHPPEVALPAPPPYIHPANLLPPPPLRPRRNYPAPPGELSHVPPPQMYRPVTATAYIVISPREGVVSSGRGLHQTGLPADLQNLGMPVTARSRMLRGERYLHFQDTALRDERMSCRKAVEAYNDSCRAVNASSSLDRERNFVPVYEPRARAWEPGKAWDGPRDSVGSQSVVETPFNCEFGYNINLGKDVLIQQNCTLQDASIIYIGDRSIIGPNVKFYCITTSVDAQQRRGSRGNFQAGPIRVEEDVVIHADCTILPFRTIGKGAVIGAGSVVTRVSSGVRIRLHCID